MPTAKPLRPGSEIGEAGHPVGRDPRRMSQDELRAMGHEPMSATQAIRAHCLDCCAGSATEVRLCMALRCPSWPWRMGKNPWRAPPSEARREAGRRLAAKQAEKSTEAPFRPGVEREVAAGYYTPTGEPTPCLDE